MVCPNNIQIYNTVLMHSSAQFPLINPKSTGKYTHVDQPHILPYTCPHSTRNGKSKAPHECLCIENEPVAQCSLWQITAITERKIKEGVFLTQKSWCLWERWGLGSVCCQLFHSCSPLAVQGQCQTVHPSCSIMRKFHHSI